MSKYSTGDSKHAGGLSKPLLGVYVLSPTIGERALGYFSANSSMWLRNHDLVDDLCMAGDIGEPLLAKLFNQARMDYVKALQLTNAALRSPTDVRKDTTLFSVMILSVFEMIAGSNEHSLEAWTEHIKGASTLIKLRGPSQFQTKAGQRLFMQVTSNLMISCVQRTIRIPDHVIEFRKLAEQFIMPTIRAVWEVSGVIFDFTNFRAAVRDCDIVGPRAIIEEALAIDRKFDAAFADVPESWTYTTMYADEDDKFIWNRRYHVYNDFWAAQTWNGMRSCRILLHEIVRDQLLAASTAITPIFTEEESKEQNKQSVQAMLDMQADILASIPSHLPEDFAQRMPSLMEASRGYFVLWPLYMAGVMDLATQPTKNWVIGRLRAIASRSGIQQATVLADILEEHRHIAAWDTKPAPRLRKDGTFFGWTPASGTGTVRPEWWDVEAPETTTSGSGY
ncbi:Uncharacterized protein D0Z07_4537 [Hyphodiscus hymeniophilus]|uniref:Uncharacterized protein n=1 Tax=Hyphodiscus hymeniophilus TaxID=353542 RepID=A0A9P6VJM6_9HELO|nr:Uncharacterized protein D0Z07_4537 [Hyphodiscus hymeniophilus]